MAGCSNLARGGLWRYGRGRARQAPIGRAPETTFRLGLEPWHIARTGEAVASEVGLASYPRDEAHRGRWLATMVAHPQLIQRPILTADDGTTVVGREPDALGVVIAAERDGATT